MLANTKIFQIYYKPGQLALLEPEFTPYDNTANLRPELREWYVWDKMYQQCCDDGLEYWGFVSQKFSQKTNLTGAQYLEFINANPGFELYFVNPAIINEAVHANSWEQGDIHHPNISVIGNSFLTKLGYTDIDVKSLILDREKTMFANYIVGSRAFWDKFMEFSRKLFTEAENDATFNEQVFGAGLSNYAGDKTLPNFTFLIERLIPTFIELEEIPAKAYQYTRETLPSKYLPYIADIEALSSLKVLINRHNCDDLYHVWDYYRLQFLRNNPGILGLE